MNKYSKIAFIFPGQGAQYPGMGKDFSEKYSLVREVYEEADDILHRKLSLIVWEGSEEELMATGNSQPGIYVTSIALTKLLQSIFPTLKPSICAGLSLGEYSALTASGKLPFQAGLLLVQQRGNLMNEACLKSEGSMAVIMGLDAEAVEDLVKEANLPTDLWAANFNSPGQTVISGTKKGIEKGSDLAKERGAKRVIPLQVQGAFHSGLMKSAEEKLAPYIHSVSFLESKIPVVMNRSAQSVNDLKSMKQQLIEQVTHPVRWEQSVHLMCSEGVDLFIEIGCGETLKNLNKRNGVIAPTFSLNKLEDLDILAKEVT